MTSPITLLLPIAAAEPAQQPAPVEDPALFAAALVAALQSALVQTPAVPVPVSANTSAEQPTPQDDAPTGNGEGTGSAPDSSVAASDGQAPSAVNRSPRSGSSPSNSAAAGKAAATPVVRQGRLVAVAMPGAQTDTALPSAPTAGPVAEGREKATAPSLPSRTQLGRPTPSVQLPAEQSPGPAVAAADATPTPASPVMGTPVIVAPPADAAAMAVPPAGLPTFRPEGRTTEAGDVIWTTVPAASESGQADSAVAQTAGQKPAASSGAPTSTAAPAPRAASAPRATMAATGDTDLYPSEGVQPSGDAHRLTPGPGPKRVRVSQSWEHASLVVPTMGRLAESPAAVSIAPGQANDTQLSPGEAHSPRHQPGSRTAEEESTPPRESLTPSIMPPAVLAMSVPMQAPPTEPTAEQAEHSGEPGTAAPATETVESAMVPLASTGEAAAGRELPVPDAETSRGLAFARELAALLGDAEINELKVTMGRRPHGDASPAPGGEPSAVDPPSLDATQRTAASPTTRSQAPLAVPGVADFTQPSALPLSAALRESNRQVDRAPDDDRLSAPGADRAPVPSATVAGPKDPGVVFHSAAAGVMNRRAPGRSTEADRTPRNRESAERETVRVRLAQAAPQRSAPQALPLDDVHPDRAAVQSRAPILPAARQELPASSERDGEAVVPARGNEQLETREPSDLQDRASIATLPQSAPASRGDGRAKDVLSGEARNMPDRAETKERPAGLADRVTLQVADADGRQTRIRVTVLGDQVRAVLLPSDQESARHLERRMDDLQAALVRQGFADPKVSVQSPPAASTAVPWGAAPAGTQAEHASGRGTDQPAEDRGQGSGRQEQDRRGDGQRQSQQRFRERDRDDRQNQDA